MKKIKINEPLNKYFKVATRKDIYNYTGEEFKSIKGLIKKYSPIVGYEDINIIGYAIAKDKYMERLAFDGYELLEIDDEGNLYFHGGGRLFNISKSEIENCINGWN